MKSSLLFFISIILFTFGCKSSTEPTANNKLGSSITVTSNSSPSLDGGGRWFAGADTGVWYDVNIAYSLNNSSSTAKDISYKLEIGEYKNGKFSSGNGGLFFDGDSTTSGLATVSGNSISALNVESTIGIGRKNAKDWSYPYGYRLTLYDKATNDSLVITNSLNGSTLQNRFHGIIFTTESSPDPIGTFDAPDDGDWKIDSVLGMGLEPCYPNPSSGTFFSTVERIGIPKKDSLILTINKTKRSTLRTIVLDLFDPGIYDVDIIDSSFKSGTYRIYGNIFGDGKSFTSHGDVMFSHQ